MNNWIAKNKNILLGLIAVILVVIYTGAVRYLTIQDNKEVISALENSNKQDKLNKDESLKREQFARKQRDSVISLLNDSRKNEIIFFTKFNNLEKSIQGLKIDYQLKFNELKEITNEKDAIPNASLNEQLDFISKYKYSEYQ